VRRAIWIWGLLRSWRNESERRRMTSAPHISLVIPAFNEAEYLPRLLDTVDAAKENYQHGTDRIEVIVADNDSTDATPDIGRARGCHVQYVEKQLIAASRNGGAAVATGEIIAFADADFRIHPETFNFIDSVMARPGYIGGATGLEMERWSPGIAVTWYMILPAIRLSRNRRIRRDPTFCRRCGILAETETAWCSPSPQGEVGYPIHCPKAGAGTGPGSQLVP
jgi:glycosyltransferase involved in cell wall biosynthesis